MSTHISLDPMHPLHPSSTLPPDMTISRETAPPAT